MTTLSRFSAVWADEKVASSYLDLATRDIDAHQPINVNLLQQLSALSPATHHRHRSQSDVYGAAYLGSMSVVPLWRSSTAKVWD